MRGWTPFRPAASSRDSRVARLERFRDVWPTSPKADTAGVALDEIRFHMASRPVRLSLDEVIERTRLGPPGTEPFFKDRHRVLSDSDPAYRAIAFLGDADPARPCGRRGQSR